MGLGKIRKWFFNFNFWGGILSRICCFGISRKFQIFFIHNMTYFKKKQFHLSVGQFFKFFDTKTEKRQKRYKMKKIPFLKQSEISLANPKLYEALSTLSTLGSIGVSQGAVVAHREQWWFIREQWWFIGSDTRL